MQVSVETISGLERRMKVELPGERVANEIDNRLKSIAQNVRMDGFRPGKVPFNVVKQRYENEVRDEVLGELMKNAFFEAVIQQKLNPVGTPNIDLAPFVAGNNFEFTATFEVYPEIKLQPMDQLEIEKPAAEIKEEDVDAMIDKVRKQQTVWEDVKRPAKEGDRVTIDFVGTINGESFDGNVGTHVPVILGSGRMIEGFEDHLRGAVAGADTTLEVTFPETYHYKAVAGKPAKFEIKVHKVEEAIIPEVDEEFIKAVGVEDGNYESFREEVRHNMRHQLDHAVYQKLKQQVIDKLYDLNKIEIPKALLDHEVNTIKHQTGLPESYVLNEEQRASFEERARKRVATSLVFNEIVRENKFAVSPERLREEVEKVANAYEESEQVVSWYYDNKDRLSEIEGMVLDNMVVDWVTSQAKVKEVPASFDEVVGKH